ncbi:MAG: TetR/AcrR family transcriptional regulator [Thomasclavelia sp.]|nr:TetR/AcrR family transcriptional regulator [Thomasclavelia sp.]
MDKRIIKTRQAIEDAYFKLLKDNDSSKITITNIAKEANIDRKTFYLHYHNVDEIINNFFQKEHNKFVSLITNGDDFYSILTNQNLINCLNKTVEENFDKIKILASKRGYDYLWNEMIKRLTDILVDHYKSEFKTDEIQFRIYIQYYICATINVYLSWVKGELPITIDQLGELTNNAAIEGAKKIYNKHVIKKVP